MMRRRVAGQRRVRRLPRRSHHEDLHPLRENGTRGYLWWAYDKLEDLRPLLKR